MLTPSLYPRKEFEKATKLQTVLNELIHNVAHDEEFLKETLASTIKADEFTAGLFKIYETILAEGAAQVRTSDFLSLRNYKLDEFNINVMNDRKSLWDSFDPIRCLKHVNHVPPRVVTVRQSQTAFTVALLWLKSTRSRAASDGSVLVQDVCKGASKFLFC